MQRLINTHVEASKIGRQIAEQVIDSQRRAGDSSSGSSPDPDTNHIIPMTPTEVSTLHFLYDSLLGTRKMP